ncbi:MAG TPA: TetR/AcrR family transcriptional regulator C-terminal domain-containing protein [Streptosporangiaceae bacterium]
MNGVPRAGKTAGTRRPPVRSLPADRFPVLAAIGEHSWVDDRDERFAASLATLVNGLQAARQPH